MHIICYFTFDLFPIVKSYGFLQTKIHETFLKKTELHRLLGGRVATNAVARVSQMLPFK